MFYEYAVTYHMPFGTLSLYPPAADRQAWESLDETWKKDAVALGRSYLHYSYPQLSAADFLDFTRTGNRVRYEEKYFARRRALDALVLAECVVNTGEFLTDIINGIFCICEESGWQLPPHNSYQRDTPQLPLPDAARPVLDLFACETAAILATARYLLREQLDDFSPVICKRIRHELETRIFKPYLSSHFWWMGNGEEPMNNWTVWCTQNVLLAVFLMETEEDFKRRVVAKACRSIDYFLAEYGEDGCCDEGALYYRHAGLCLFNALEVLNAVTYDYFADLYRKTKVRNIAAYLMNVHVQDQYYVNFADCSPMPGRCSAREFLFARRTGNQAMTAFAARDFMSGLPQTLMLPEENNLYYRLQNAFTVQEIFAYADRVAKTVIRYPDIFYPSTGLFIARDDIYFLSVKAGCNGDSHNHNDTGSFTVYKNGFPLLIDAGVESYTKKTFSPQRYEIWTMQSAYHNLPTVNGCMQKDGKAYGAVDTQTWFGKESCEIRMDIAKAYPAQAGLVRYDRHAVLVKGKEIRIEDAFLFAEKADCDAQTSTGECDAAADAGASIRSTAARMDKAAVDKDHGRQQVVLSLMTYEKVVMAPQKQEDGLLLKIGDKGVMRITGGKYVETEEIPVTDQRLKTAWEHAIYRTLIEADGTAVKMHIW